MVGQLVGQARALGEAGDRVGRAVVEQVVLGRVRKSEGCEQRDWRGSKQRVGQLLRGCVPWETARVQALRSELGEVSMHEGVDSAEGSERRLSESRGAGCWLGQKLEQEQEREREQEQELAELRKRLYVPVSQEGRTGSSGLHPSPRLTLIHLLRRRRLVLQSTTSA